MCCCGYDGGWQQVAMIRPLTWELTCAAGVVLKSRGKKKGLGQEKEASSQGQNKRENR